LLKKIVDLINADERKIIFENFWNMGDFKEGKGKVIPLHAMEVLGARGGIAPTHS
jgi:hypothetical protein